MKTLKRGIWALLVIGLMLVGWGSWKVVYSPNTAFEGKEKYLYIRTGTSFEQLLEKLRHNGIIRSSRTFLWSAKLLGLSRVVPGKYLIASSSNNATVVRMLRDGVQTPVIIQLTGTPTVEALCGKLARQLEKDSATFAAVLLQPDTIAAHGHNYYTWPSALPAKGYTFQWDAHPATVLASLLQEGRIFWSPERLQKAAQLSLTPDEVATLASIVRGETVRSEEAPIIAGLYLNRLQKGMKLQSDPTVTFAKGLSNVQRVLNDDLAVESPYNTYRIQGLPPGPISLPEPHYMEAVLNAAQHDYLFMCAQPGGSGYHDFTASDLQHMANARAYRQWLDTQNIRR